MQDSLVAFNIISNNKLLNKNEVPVLFSVILVFIRFLKIQFSILKIIQLQKLAYFILSIMK